MNKNSEIEWVSFDLFGTLVYYTRAHWLIFMLRAGLFSKVSRDIFKKGVLESVTTNLYLDDIIFRENNFSPSIAHLFDAYLQDELSSVRLYSDVSAILEYFKARGYKIALTSNLAKDFSKPVLDMLPITPDATIFSYEVTHRKPEPEIFQVLLNKTGVPAEKIVHIGDRYNNDYVASRELGMKALLLERSNVKNFSEINRIKSLHEIKYLL